MKIPPALVLFLLAPAIGELLSGSSPPLEFLNPVGFVFMAALYGSGAIVVRELKIRWRKGFRSMLLLGAACGILEEGLLVKSFFDPSWMDLGVLATYGRWAGVSWVWTEMLIIYHAVFSITIPIVLAELAYPSRKEEKWIGNRALAAFIAVLIVVTAIGYMYLTEYRPPSLHYLLTVAAMFLFVFAAFKLPSGRTELTKKRKAKSRIFFFLVCVFSTSFFMLMFAGPYIFGNPLVLMLLGLLLILGSARFLSRFDWSFEKSALTRLAAAAGALSFLVFLDFLLELSHQGIGMSLVGTGTMVAILLFRRKIKQRSG